MDMMFANVASNVDWPEIGRASWDTLLMLGGSMALTVLFGVPLGVLLYLSGKGRLAANPVLNAVLSLIVNILRSVPFIILLIVMLPVTVMLVGTSLGVAGAIPPLVVGAAPFYARLVETALREVDKGVVEASQAMGASTFQIVTRALLPEALPGIIAGATVTGNMTISRMMKGTDLRMLTISDRIALSTGLAASRPLPDR